LVAAANYNRFLKRFKHHKEAYKLSYYLADTLYFTSQFKNAAIQFKKVRDWPGEKKFFQESAYSLVDSLVHIVNNECKAGRIQRACELPETRKKEQQKNTKKKKKRSSRRRRTIKPLPIPEQQKRLVAARQFFLKKVKDPKDKRIPEQMYLLSRIYYKYDHLSTARALLWDFIRRFRSHKYAKFAGETIVATHYREGNDDDMLQAMDKLRSHSIHVKDAGLIRLGAAFRKAELLENKGKFALAAQAYVDIIKKNPKIPKAASALWNAAYLYTRAHRYGSSIKIYEQIVRDYPTWEKAPQALFNVAYNAEKYFLFKKAISRYMKLVNNRDFRSYKRRDDALYNAALLLENLQRYQEASRAYIRYSTTFKDKKDAPEMLFRAALIHKRQKNWDEMTRILKLFIRRYRNNDDQARRVMLAHGYILEVEEKKNHSDRVKKRMYRDIIDIFQRLVSRMKPVDIVITRRFPAKAAYMLTMFDYRKFLKLKITSRRAKVQVRQRDKKILAYAEVSKKFSQIVSYNSAPWLLCAMYRIAEGKQKIAEVASKAPLPKIKGL